MLVLGLCPKGFVENQEEPVPSQASFVALGCQTQQESKQNQGKEAQDGLADPWISEQKNGYLRCYWL